MARRKRRLRKRLSDQELLEGIVQLTQHYQPGTKRDFWKRAIGGALFAGPFLALIAVIGWPERLLGTRWNVLIFLGINALFSLLPAFLYQFSPEERFASISSEKHERRSAYKDSFLFLIFLSWLAFFGSIMLLLGTIGMTIYFFPGFPWGVVLGICLALGAGFWWQRMALLRAIVEGPDAHPWFWPALLFFAILSTGGFGAIFRVFTEVANLAVRNLGDIFAIGLIVGGYALFIGLTVVAISIARLHYQKWRGAEVLRP